MATNHYAVGVRGDQVVIQSPGYSTTLAKKQAINLACWILAVVGVVDGPDFELYMEQEVFRGDD